MTYRFVILSVLIAILSAAKNLFSPTAGLALTGDGESSEVHQ